MLASQRQVLQTHPQILSVTYCKLCVSGARACFAQQPPFHFCQDSLPHLGLFSCSLESLLNSPSSSGLPLSAWTVLYSFAHLLCLQKNMGQCRKLGTKKIRAMPLFSIPCLGQVDGWKDWTESAGTEGRKLARTYWGVSFVGCEEIPTDTHEVPSLWETTF